MVIDKIGTQIKNKITRNKPQAISPIVFLTLAACSGNSEEDASNSGLSFSINENSTTLTLGSILAEGEEVSSSSFALTGEDADSFELSETGDLSLKAAANYEDKASYSITINVTTTTPSMVAGDAPTISTVSRDYIVNVANVNDPATGTLTVEGAALQGETLKVDMTGIADEDGIGPVIYKWYRDGAVVTGQSDSEFTLTQADVGSVISAEISYIDGAGATETFTTNGTAAVSNKNDAPTGVPTISGALSENRELTVNTSSIMDADGLGELSIQWNRDGVAIEGANQISYTLTTADIGTNISVTVTYTDGFGSAESVVSAETASITKANDAPTGSLVISGVVAEGSILTLDTSAIADVDGLGTFSYVWLKDGQVVTEETGSTYTLTQEDVGSVFSASVSYVDGLGVTETLAAAATAVVTNVNDSPTGTLAITGVAEKGATLTLDATNIEDEDGLGTFSVTWRADGNEIAGATGNSYTLDSDDVGKAISVVIEYIDGQGTLESISSAATSLVRDVIVESLGAIRAVNTGTGTNMVLEFFVDTSVVTTSVTSFDAIVRFDTAEATLISADIETGYLGFPNANDGVVNLSGISLAGGSNTEPLFTLSLTDLNAVDELVVYVSDVLVNNQALEGSTLLIA